MFNDSKKSAKTCLCSVQLVELFLPYFKSCLNNFQMIRVLVKIYYQNNIVLPSKKYHNTFSKMIKSVNIGDVKETKF